MLLSGLHICLIVALSQQPIPAVKESKSLSHHRAIELVRQAGDPLDLSIYLETEAAIDRAQRWLAVHKLPQESPALTHWLYDYATLKAPASHPATLPFKQIAPFVKATQCPVTDKVLLKESLALPATMPTGAGRFQALFQRAQRLLLKQSDWQSIHPLPDWRLIYAETIVNQQKVVEGDLASWQTIEDTIWAIIALRALRGDLIAIEQEKAPTLQKQKTSTPKSLTKK